MAELISFFWSEIHLEEMKFHSKKKSENLLLLFVSKNIFHSFRVKFYSKKFIESREIYNIHNIYYDI